MGFLRRGCDYVRDLSCINCCLCGKAGDGMRVCGICGHQFCGECRKNKIERIKGALKMKEMYCNG